MCKLHIGSGRVALQGWINLDMQPLPGVDVVNDVTDGLPFVGAQFIFAEHFIEHLPFDAGLQFLRECRAVLAESGVLRVSTPNLDWVLRSHYDPSRWESTAEPIRDCLWLNKAFRGWGHCFLHNMDTLAQVLSTAGFAFVISQECGCSRYAALASLESRENYPDLPTSRHVLVVEASGVVGEISLALAAGGPEFLIAINSSEGSKCMAGPGRLYRVAL
jgi:predicted SAM-dependent methyltransferase